MSLDPMKVGREIYILRKIKGLTQSQLGDRLHVSFQAVSKWERGETLPDVTLLPDLAAALETTVDHILNGGDGTMNGNQERKYTRKATVAQMREGIACFDRLGELLGKDSIFYYAAVGGVGLRMNTPFGEYLDRPEDDDCRELFVAEAVTEAMERGAYFDPEDLRTGFLTAHATEVVLEFAKKYGIT